MYAHSSVGKLFPISRPDKEINVAILYQFARVFAQIRYHVANHTDTQLEEVGKKDARERWKK